MCCKLLHLLQTHSILTTVVTGVECLCPVVHSLHGCTDFLPMGRLPGCNNIKLRVNVRANRFAEPGDKEENR